MPCYNAESFINRTLELLVNQSIGIDNLEVICVDDASTDGTYDILCEWESKYPESFIIVHCDENGRQGRARNIGLSYASAKYVGFIDDDDVIKNNLYEALYNSIEEHDADVSMCGTASCSITEIDSIIKSESASTDDEVITIDTPSKRAYVINSKLGIAIWNKVYKKSLIMDNNIAFLEGMIYDDIFFTGLIGHYINKLAVVGEKMYFHVESTHSVSLTNKDKNLECGYINSYFSLIEELQNRKKFDTFRLYYEQIMLINYVSFIEHYIRRFGGIELTLWTEIKDRLIFLLPSISQNVIIQDLKSEKIASVLVDSLFGNINDEYYSKVYNMFTKEK